MGQSPSSDSYNNDKQGMPLIQGNADCENRKTKPKLWTKDITKICHIGDVILTVRAPAGEVSKSYHNACIGRGVCAIRAKDIESEYLYQLLILYESAWSRLAQGSTFTAINSDDIRSMEIPVPISNTIQKKIAEILCTWDEMIEITEKLIDLKTQMKKGLMKQSGMETKIRLLQSLRGRSGSIQNWGN